MHHHRKLFFLLFIPVLFTNCDILTLKSEGDWNELNKKTTADNLIINGDFSSWEVIERDGDRDIAGQGWYYYNYTADVTVDIFDDKGRVQVSNNSGDFWNVTFNYAVSQIKLNTSYRLSFIAYADAPSQFSLAFYRDNTGENDVYYTNTTLSMGTTPTTYTFDFTTQAITNTPPENIALSFELGYGVDTTFYFDNVSLIEQRN